MNAWELRTLAEQTDNPELYEHAAAEFERMGYEASSARCRDRAALYRDQLANLPTCIGGCMTTLYHRPTDYQMFLQALQESREIICLRSWAWENGITYANAHISLRRAREEHPEITVTRLEGEQGRPLWVKWEAPQ